MKGEQIIQALSGVFESNIVSSFNILPDKEYQDSHALIRTEWRKNELCMHITIILDDNILFDECTIRSSDPAFMMRLRKKMIQFYEKNGIAVRRKNTAQFETTSY